MDEIIKRYHAETMDDDLTLCPSHGVAYQSDMTFKVPYDEAYFNKCLSYEDQTIALKINAGRKALVERFVPADQHVLDVGVGSGEFIKKRPFTFGYDVNPAAKAWLEEQGLYRNAIEKFHAFTFWDVIEHVEEPSKYFRAMPAESYLFTSVPIFDDLSRVRESKHYRPGEHLYYWTAKGFVDWMAAWGFHHLVTEDYEIKAGRESILSFAFQKTGIYHYLLGQYQKLHETRHYGSSGKLYLDHVATTIFKHNPESILDYGCGRSDLVAYFWYEGRRRLERYDPAINEYKTMPPGRFDLVLCFDVMEHINACDVDRVLQEIRGKSNNVIFAISLKPARARLPDGRNPHVTLLTRTEWTKWIESYFPRVQEMGTPWDHVLLLKTF